MSRALVASGLLLLTACDNRAAGQQGMDEGEARYAREHTVGRYQMVKGEDMHAVFVLDTTTGLITACNMEIVRYSTWCGIPAQADKGAGPPEYGRTAP